VLMQRLRFIEVSVVSESGDGRVLTQFTGTTLLVNAPECRVSRRRVTDLAARGHFVLRDDRDRAASD